MQQRHESLTSFTSQKSLINVKNMDTTLFADDEDADQTVWMHRVILVFVRRT